jgi:transposase-like protein
MSKLAHVGDFCPNSQCADYGKPQTARQKNIIRFGLTQAGRQRYQCQTCGQTFTETKGTLFYRRRTTADEILKTLAQVAEAQRISSVTRTTGHKEDTVLDWLREAAQHVEAIDDVLMADYQVSRGQLDGLWAYVGNKGEKKAIPKRKRPASSGAPPC